MPAMSDPDPESPIAHLSGGLDPVKLSDMPLECLGDLAHVLVQTASKAFAKVFLISFRVPLL
jgi:hypothetical protein